jgi:hypothetical protein
LFRRPLAQSVCRFQARSARPSNLDAKNPKLGELYKKMAANPWGTWVELNDEAAAVLKQRATKYDADSHAGNPFANGASETDKAQFVRNVDAATVEQAKREAVPITSPVGRGYNLTTQGRISRIPKLSALFNGAMTREREWKEGARQKAKADIEAAQKNLKELEAAK